MTVGTAVLSMWMKISVLNAYVICQKFVQLDIIPWLEMDFVMMALILLNVIMMAENVVDIVLIQNIVKTVLALATLPVLKLQTH